MTKESLEELRERLIRDERVRQMIRVRAYEIFQMRGHHPGSQAHDWYQAESEVLAFLIADESQQVDEKESQQHANLSSARAPHGETIEAKGPKPRRTSATKKAVPKAQAAKRVTTKKPAGRTPKRTRNKAKPAGAE